MGLVLGELTAVLKIKGDEFRKGLGDAKKEFKQHGEQLKTMGVAAGAAIGVAMAAGLAGALETDKAKAKLAAQLGGDAQYAKDMGSIAGNVYGRGFGESLEAVNETLRGVLTSGLVEEDATNAEIESVTMKAEVLADVFGQDVTGMARAAGQMVRNGLAANSAEAFDILAAGFQQTGDHAGDLLDTFSEYSTQFRKLGIDGEAATGLMSQGLKAGARDADTVADALKELSIRAIDGSKASTLAYEALGLNAEAMTAQMAKGGPAASKGLQTILDRLRGMKDPVARSAAAVGLFGTKAEDLGDALFALDPSTAVKSLGDVEGAAGKVGKTLEQSASQQLEAFKRQAQAALVEKMAAAVPYLQQVAGFLQQHGDVIGPLATGLGALAIVIGTIIGVYKVWTAVQTALNIVQMLSPTTWIILGIVALIAIIVLVATKTQFFQTIWENVWGFLKKVGAWFAGPFANFFVSGWKIVTDKAEQAWSWITIKTAKFMIWIGNVPGRIAGFFSNGWKSIQNRAGAAFDWVKNKATSWYNWIIDLPHKISSKMAGAFSGLWTGFRGAANKLIGGWNRLSFGVPGFSFAGVSVPGVNISTPDIPYLARGGIVPATPGGRLVGVGEGGEAEAVIPLSKLSGMFGRTVLELRSSGSRIDDFLLEILRTAISRRGGNVQVVLGGTS